MPNVLRSPNTVSPATRFQGPVDNPPPTTPHQHEPVDPLPRTRSSRGRRNSFGALGSHDIPLSSTTFVEASSGALTPQQNHGRTNVTPSDVLERLVKALTVNPHSESRFRTPSIKAPDRFEGDNPSELRPFLQ